MRPPKCRICLLATIFGLLGLGMIFEWMLFRVPICPLKEPGTYDIWSADLALPSCFAERPSIDNPWVNTTEGEEDFNERYTSEWWACLMFHRLGLRISMKILSTNLFLRASTSPKRKESLFILKVSLMISNISISISTAFIFLNGNSCASSCCRCSTRRKWTLAEFNQNCTWVHSGRGTPEFFLGKHDCYQSFSNYRIIL